MPPILKRRPKPKSAQTAATPVTVTVRLFAGVRERARAAALSVTLPSGGTVEDALLAAGKGVPGEWRLPTQVMIALNGEYAGRDARLSDGDEIAVIPPVSGGARRRATRNGRGQDARAASAPSLQGRGSRGRSRLRPHIRLTDRPLDPAPIAEQVRTERDGAIVTFLGVTRDHNDGRRVAYLEYEAYQPMAEQKIAEIIAEMKTRWDIGGVAVAHRTGRVDIGETSMVLAVSAAHRRPAFEAALYFVDRLKEIVPIWKKEHYEGGTMWIGETPGSKPPAAGRKA